jgi:hypothetical protein
VIFGEPHPLGVVRRKEEAMLEKGNFKVVKDIRKELLRILNIQPVGRSVGHVDKIKKAVVYREGVFEDEELGAFVDGDSFFVPLDEIVEVARAKGLKVSVLVPWHTDNEELKDSVVWTIEGEGGVNLTIIEKSCNSPRRGGFYWGRGQNFVCGIRLEAVCECCNVEYVVKKPCGREWCPECGRPYSLYHRQLYLKVLAYGLEMLYNAGAVGYLVITCPEELREEWKSKEALSKVVEYVRRLLKREGFPYGVYRWHFAGEKGLRWYPHLNILIPWGYMEPEKLERLKTLIYHHYGIKVVYYTFTRSLRKLRHLARYIARPTWLLQNEVDPKEFKNFRKIGIWGNQHFKSASLERPRELEDFVARLEELVRVGFLRRGVEVMAYAVLQGYCAFCYEKLKWRRLKSWWLDSHSNLVKLGWGIWLIVPKGEFGIGSGPPPPTEPEDEEFWYF